MQLINHAHLDRGIEKGGKSAILALTKRITAMQMKFTLRIKLPHPALLLALFCAFFLLPASANAQNEEASSPDDASALGVRQQRVKRMLKELEGKFGELSKKLREEQPDQADKLDSAFKQSKNLLLEQRMDDITGLLNAAKLETASEEQDKMVDDVKALISMLLAEDDDKDKRQKDIEQLEAWKKQLDELIQDENKLKNESEIMENKEGALNEMNRQIDKMKDLIAQQEELKKDTENGEPKAQDELDKLADKQADIRKDTEQLADQAEQSASEAPEGEKPKSPGLEKMREAAGEQKESEQKLAEGQPQQSGQKQEGALSKMKAALEEMEKEKDRIDKMNEEERNKELADEQGKTNEDTEKLEQEMAQSPQSAEEQNPQEGVKGAQESMKKAQESMKKAQQSLGQQSPGEASEEQKKAEEELEKAREQIQEKINELKEEEKKEQLAKLEEIFREMLVRQEQATAGTAKVDEDRKANEEGKLMRAQRIALKKWTTEEDALSKKAGETYDLLFEEDKSVVFRTVVEELQFSLESIAKMMDEQKTGNFVQQSQKEIEDTLKELIAALEKEQEKMEQQDPQDPQQGQQGEQSLLATSAELKLLKLAQLRVNRLTVEVDKEVAEERPKEALGELTDRQMRLMIMALEMASRAELKSEEQID